MGHRNLSPRVSVVVPMYNREGYIAQALESMLAQSFEDFELIVIDDGSSDRSVEIVTGYDDSRIRLVRNECNMGISRTRNRGLELARGEYLAVMDSDEVSRPDRLMRQVRFLDRRSDIDVVGSWARQIRDDGTLTPKLKRRPLKPAEIDFWLTFRCAVLQYTMMGRTEAFRRYRYREEMQICDDHDLLLRMAPQCRFANIAQPLVWHRVHDTQSTTHKRHRIRLEQMQIVSRRLSDWGVAHGESDLKRHFCLAHLKSWNVEPDQEFLEWAESWLIKLRDAAMGADPRYNPVAARIAADLWAATCWHARRRVGSLIWRRFVSSSLSRDSWRSLSDRMRIYPDLA